MSEARITYDNLRGNHNPIKIIGTDKLNSKRPIDKAQKLYDALSDELKKLVNNAKDLFDAIDQLFVLIVVNAAISKKIFFDMAAQCLM